MKAIVVIDMPTKCSNCPFIEEWFNEHGKKSYYCPLHRMEVSKNGDVCEKLRPLPQKMPPNEFGNMSLRKSGWNACIDEILGEK